MATSISLDLDALTRPAAAPVATPETTDDPTPDDLAALWLDLGGGD